METLQGLHILDRPEWLRHDERPPRDRHRAGSPRPGQAILRQVAQDSRPPGLGLHGSGFWPHWRPVCRRSRHQRNRQQRCVMPFKLLRSITLPITFGNVIGMFFKLLDHFSFFFSCV